MKQRKQTSTNVIIEDGIVIGVVKTASTRRVDRILAWEDKHGPIEEGSRLFELIAKEVK